MRFWWVNQNQTYKSEVPGGFLWSPKTKSNGGRNQFYVNMQEVMPGDVIFSFCKKRIKAIGIARGRAQTSAKPDFGDAGSSWSTEGWLVPVEFKELTKQIQPRDHLDKIRDHLPEKYAPLHKVTGAGFQSVYLAALSESLASALADLIGSEYDQVVTALSTVVPDGAEAESDQVEASIRGRTDIGPTQKQQLVLARRGQGIFKANVRLNESACRVTRTTDPAHLRASHIKPWRNSTDTEKLDGCNGLLLAPHVDHLFDRGLISFADNGDLLVAGQLDLTVLTQWGIPAQLNVGQFSPEQAQFLSYHRANVFKD